MLVAFQTHPVQYHAPVFRAVETTFNVPVTVVYGSDFSVAGFRDREFGAEFAWDTDLLSGYHSVFLSRASEGGARDFDHVSTRGLAAALAQTRPAAVLIGGYSPHFHRAAFFHAWRAGLPILFRAETTDAEPASAVGRLARNGGLRRLYRRASRLLYIGARSKRHYERLGSDPSQLVFSPYCVDATTFEADESARARLREPMRQHIGVSADHIVILFSGKLIPKKRPDLLVAAVRDVSATIGRPLAIVFLGDGELRASLEAERKTADGVHISFEGFKNQRMLSPYYHAADVLVLPSQHSETWGLVVNEALLHGVPCVVSSAVGCSEDLVIAGQTGEIFDVGSRAGLAAALDRIVPLIGRSDVRERCRALVARYSVERAACGIAQAYQSVVAA